MADSGVTEELTLEQCLEEQGGPCQVAKPQERCFRQRDGMRTVHQVRVPSAQEAARPLGVHRGRVWRRCREGLAGAGCCQAQEGRDQSCEVFSFLLKATGSDGRLLMGYE